MKRAVIDPGALLSWFDAVGGDRSIRTEYESGKLTLIAPRHLPADVLGEVASRDDISPERLALIAGELHRMEVQLQDPPLVELAGWLAKGLTARQAAYPALAASLDVPLVTADPDLHRVASGLLLRR